MEFNAKQLESMYRSMTLRAEAHCTLRTEIVGGMPADREAIAAFVEHHLHKTGDEAAAIVARLMNEEVQNVSPEAAELLEQQTYGLTVIRRDEFGPWIGDWMIKACLKAAASRLAYFTKLRGVKGDMAEMGRAAAIDQSLWGHGNPQRIHLLRPNGDPALTTFREFKGRISGPSGSMSICSHKEVAPAGTQFHFEYRWFDGKLKPKEAANVFAAAMNIGLGSAKAFECGKFTIDRLVIEETEQKVEAEELATAAK